MRTRARLVIAISIVVLSACSGESAPRERPLTGDEASTMAGVQFSNMRAGGATFEVVASSTVTGETLSMSGVVDWARHAGRATVTAGGSEAAVTEIAWAGAQVLERRSDVAALLPGLGFAPDAWILRPIDTRSRSIDRVAAILTKLSSEDQENAILIQQTEGSAWMRTDVLRGAPVDVLRFGKQTLYWLDSTSKELLRFEGNNASFTAPVIIDFLERGPREVPLPGVAEVVEVSKIRDLYDALTAR